MNREDVERFEKVKRTLGEHYGRGTSTPNNTKIASFSRTPLNAYELNVLGSLYCEELVSFEDLVFRKDDSSNGKETESIKFLEKKGYLQSFTIGSRKFFALSETGKSVVEYLLEKRKAASNQQSP